MEGTQLALPRSAEDYTASAEATSGEDTKQFPSALRVQRDLQLELENLGAAKQGQHQKGSSTAMCCYLKVIGAAFQKPTFCELHDQLSLIDSNLPTHKSSRTRFDLQRQPATTCDGTIAAKLIRLVETTLHVGIDHLGYGR